MSYNQLTELPEALGDLRALEFLYVSNNKLARLAGVDRQAEVAGVPEREPERAVGTPRVDRGAGVPARAPCARQRGARPALLDRCPRDAARAPPRRQCPGRASRLDRTPDESARARPEGERAHLASAHHPWPRARHALQFARQPPDDAARRPRRNASADAPRPAPESADVAPGYDPRAPGAGEARPSMERASGDSLAGRAPQAGCVVYL